MTFARRCFRDVTLLRQCPDVVLCLCRFVVFTTKRFVLSHALLFAFECFFFLFFFQSCLAFWSPRLEKRELVYVLLVLCTRLFLSFFSSFWCQGLAATCDCGTPLTLLLYFIHRLTKLPFRVLFTTDIFGATHVPVDPHNICLSEPLAPIMEIFACVTVHFYHISNEIVSVGDNKIFIFWGKHIIWHIDGSTLLALETNFSKLGV